MMEQKAVAARQFIVAMELFHQRRASPLVRTFSCRCRSFFDVAPLLFGNPKGDCSFFFWSHYDLPSALISAVGVTNRMPADANICLRLHARRRKFIRC
jgi:hypothetical protein